MYSNENNTTGDASIVKIAANKGAFFGLYLSAVFLVFVNTGNNEYMALLAMALLIATPLVALLLMRQTYVQESYQTDFFRMWSMGLLLFAFGSVICALVTYVWLQYVHPGFIYEKAQEAIDAYMKVPELSDSPLVQVLQKAIKSGDLPTPIQFAIQMIWTTVMIGSFVAMPLAAIARLGGKKH